MRKVSLVIPGLPMSGNVLVSGKPWQRHNNSKKWRALVYDAVNRHGLPEAAFTHCFLQLVRYGTQSLDFDGLVISFKPVVDGLCPIKKIMPGRKRPTKDSPTIWPGVIIDDNFEVTGAWEVRQVKCQRGEERIEITITEVDPTSRLGHTPSSTPPPRSRSRKASDAAQSAGRALRSLLKP